MFRRSAPFGKYGQANIYPERGLRWRGIIKFCSSDGRTELSAIPARAASGGSGASASAIDAAFENLKGKSGHGQRAELPEKGSKETQEEQGAGGGGRLFASVKGNFGAGARREQEALSPARADPRRRGAGRALPHRLHWQFPAAPLRYRGLHDGSASRGLEHAAPDITASTVAMTNRGFTCDYPESVGFAVNDQVIGDYLRAADYISAADFDAVSLQHEFGIFGGEAGGHIIALLDRLTAPVVTTFHTVLAKPSAARRCSTRMILPGSSPAPESRWRARNLRSAKAMCPMSSIPAAACGTASGSSCPMPSRTHSRISRR